METKHTEAVTVTWKVDLTAPEITANADDNLGCNPTDDAIHAALGSATALDGCDGAVQVTSQDGDVLTDGCMMSQTRTFTAVDECGNEATEAVTVTWKVDLTAPEITANADDNLGCNPTADAIQAALGSATALDGCDGTVQVTSQDGDVLTDGCMMSQTRTFTAVDECGNEATEAVTVTWKVDLTAPEITANADDNLGCNPTADAIQAALGSATALDGCDGAVQVTSQDGAMYTDGCMMSQTRTFTAVDECGNEATEAVTVTWKVDLTAPEITANADDNLGCNPTADAIQAALGSATALDGCDGAVQVTSQDGDVLTDGCMMSQTRTFTAVDECGNEATEAVTVTWKVDLTAPVITANADDNLGCNPTDDAILAALGSATALDGCDGAVQVTSQDGDVLTDGCMMSQTRTFTAVDECGNEATEAVTVTWKVDLTAPVITANADDNLGCNPTADAIHAALGSATALDGCDGAVQVTSQDGDVLTDGCMMSQTRTFTAVDECGNEATEAVTVTWKVDLTAPVISGVEDYAICEEELPVTIWADWTDNCSAGGSIESAPGVPFSATECDTTYAYSFWVADDCGNTAEKTVYVTRESQKYGACETAFGKLVGEDAANATCFLDIPEIKNNRWGWTNKITVPGTYTMTMYAGAAKCEVAKGTEVGSVIVTYANGNVTVEYLLSEGYSLSEAHVYVGCTPYPIVKQGKKMTPTVAPGQYTYNGGTLDHATDLTVSFSGVGDGGFYIIVHGVACEMICACSTSEPVNSIVESDPIALALDCNIKSAEIVSGVSAFGQSDLKVYPNPFSEKVTFEFVSNVDAHATLEIDNILGQKVTTLMDQFVKGGVVNSIEYTPESKVSGMYFYRLNLNGNIQIGKLIYKNK